MAGCPIAQRARLQASKRGRETAALNAVRQSAQPARGVVRHPMEPGPFCAISLKAQRARLPAAKQKGSSLSLWAARLILGPFCAIFLRAKRARGNPRYAILATLFLLGPLHSFAQIIDYHQHLYSPAAGARSTPGPKGIDATSLIAQLDAAGIDGAVVLSVAYSFSNPNKPLVPDEYAHVMAENDWTSGQIAQYPNRLLGFCSVNPLRPYALEEIARCAKDPYVRTGLKLHFGNSDVNVDNPRDLATVRRVFQAANQHGMAIVVHMHANIDHHRPYGAREARQFLETLLPAAPDVTVQIAHLAGGGGYDDPAVDAALSVFVEAIGRKDPRTKHVYFDACGIAFPGLWEDKADLIVRRIRQIGIHHVLYGSDAATPDNLPKVALERWHKLPLTQEEFRTIENNRAPYLPASFRPAHSN